MLRRVRSFFQRRSLLEVDCPSLLKHPSFDQNIDSMEVKISEKERGFLHTSPEYAMKRLLSFGIGDIYQISHVFRKSEIGDLHNPEFTMIEWYRKKVSYRKFLREVVSLIEMFLEKSLKVERSSYRDLFLKYIDIDYVKNEEKLFQFAKKEIGFEGKIDKDSILNLILASVIEPKLCSKEIFIIDSFPLSQAALAKEVMEDGIPVAKRFEIYFKGIELANGYDELDDYKVQKRRFLNINKKRIKERKKKLTMDHKFLDALKRGFPNYFGVAVGFDRLMMLRHKKSSIKEVMPFSFEEL